MRQDRGGRRDFGGSRSGGFGGSGGGYSPVKVGDELDVKVEAVGEKGDGLAKKDGFVLFIPGTKAGQEVRVKVTRVLKKVGFAEVVGAKSEGSEEGQSEETQEQSSEGSDQGSDGTGSESQDDSGQDSEDFGEENN